MGAFIVNFHVRTRSAKNVSQALRQVHDVDAWVAVPKGKWVSFWERNASKQDETCIHELLGHVSKSLEVSAIAFLIHDSDILCFWLYDRGKQLLSYNSSPGYWGESAIDPEPLDEKCRLLLNWCRAGTDAAKVQTILAFAEQQDAGGTSQAFAEMRLHQLSPLLGIAEDRLVTDFNDLEKDVRPDEFGATKVGGNSSSDSMAEEDSEFNFDWSRKSPLFAAIARNDVSAIEQLVARGVDLNETPRGTYSSALTFAVANSTVETVRKLLHLGADPNRKVAEGITPLRQAVDCEKSDMLRVLAEFGANVNELHPELGSLLHIAFFHQRYSSIPVLVEIKVDPELKSPGGLTAREFASANVEAIQRTINKLQELKPQLPADSLAYFADNLMKLEQAQQTLSQSN